MTEDYEKLIRDFKQTFSTEWGKRVLAHLESVCMFTPAQSCFDATNEKQTLYNLGANYVARYIHVMMDAELNEKTEDCQVTEQTKTERI
jgi:hypothetical protein